MKTSRFEFRARPCVRALSLLAATLVAATVLTAAVTPAFADAASSEVSIGAGPRADAASC